MFHGVGACSNLSLCWYTCVKVFPFVDLAFKSMLKCYVHIITSNVYSWRSVYLTFFFISACQLIERFNGRLPGYIGDGNDKFSFTHVDDVVEGHIAAMEKGRPGERYLLTGENASFKYVFDAAAILTNTSKPRLTLPMWTIEAYGWISVLFARITGKLPLISPPVCFPSQ